MQHAFICDGVRTPIGRYGTDDLGALPIQPVSGTEAAAMGLASEVVADEQVEARALEIAGQLARGPQQALEFIKEATLGGMNLPLDQGLQLERKSFQLLFASRDKRTGIQARLDRTTPIFDVPSGHFSKLEVATADPNGGDGLSAGTSARVLP